jgi:hypothetical protein
MKRIVADLSLCRGDLLVGIDTRGYNHMTGFRRAVGGAWHECSTYEALGIAQLIWPIGWIGGGATIVDDDLATTC